MIMERKGLNVWNGDHNRKTTVLINTNSLKYWAEFPILGILVHNNQKSGKERSLPCSRPGPAPRLDPWSSFWRSLVQANVSALALGIPFPPPDHHLWLGCSLLSRSPSSARVSRVPAGLGATLGGGQEGRVLGTEAVGGSGETVSCASSQRRSVHAHKIR